MGLRNRSALSGAEEIQSDSYDDWVGHWEERTHLEASSMPSVFRVYRVNVHAPVVQITRQCLPANAGTDRSGDVAKIALDFRKISTKPAEHHRLENADHKATRVALQARVASTSFYDQIYLQR